MLIHSSVGVNGVQVDTDALMIIMKDNEVLSFTFNSGTNLGLLLYSVKHILKVQAELNSLSSRLEDGVCLCLLLLSLVHL